MVRHVALPQKYQQDCSRLFRLRQAALHAKGSDRDPMLIRNMNYFLSYTAWMCEHHGIRPSSLDEHGRIKLPGLFAPAFNLTWFPVSKQSQMNVFGMGANAGKNEAWKGQIDWPSRLELATIYDLTDVVVMSFGLHYKPEKGLLQPAVREALRQLDAFARTRPGRRAVFREVSIQHFAAPDGSGSYHTAAAKDEGLVRPTQGAAPLSQPCQPLAQNQAEGSSSGHGHGSGSAGPIAWQNQLLHRAIAEMGHDARVRIQPFDELTRPRWEFHLGTKSIFTGHQDGVKHFAYDCTHFCYSPAFWDASFRDLGVTLGADDDAWLRAGAGTVGH